MLKTTIEILSFPCELKEKIYERAGTKNLQIQFIDGHIIHINKTNLSITEPYKIIIKNKINTLIAYIYENSDKIYLPTFNSVVSLTKFIQIIRYMNKL